jgi:predicted transcriptional regulator YdeE
MQKANILQFSVRGASVRTSNKAEMGSAGKIPSLWGQFYASHVNQTTPIYGVYSDYESDANGEFTVTAGTKAINAQEESVCIKSGTYLVFPANGVIPAAIIDAWKAVWKHFSNTQPYVRAYETDFEEYSGPESAAIYIGIKEKQLTSQSSGLPSAAADL